MDSQQRNRSGDGFEHVVLRTFGLLVGIALFLVGLAVLAGKLLSQGISPRVFFVSREAMGSAIALGVGVVLAYWGGKRPRSNRRASEETLSRLVEKYEKQGKTKELEDAREQLIELLIEKDEENSKVKK